jgi:alpha-L-arabinofuranosidase
MGKQNRWLLLGATCICLTLTSYAQQLTGKEEITENSIVIKTLEGKDTISRNLYGQFTEHLGRCIYGGIWVGEKSTIPNTHGIRNDVIKALKDIEVPVIRWPGGCFADIYHWKDGIGPRDQRPTKANSTWGGVIEDNSFGTHEFLDFCNLIGAEPYLAVNVGSGTVREAIDWVEYVTSNDDSPMAQLRRKNGRNEPWKVKFWGIGNESWGCGGNMDPYFYTSLFKQYSTYCKVPFRVASGGMDFDTNWTATFMKNIADKPGIAQGYSYHYYSVCHDWSKKGSATDFNEKDWLLTMKAVYNMQSSLDKHITVMDRFDPENKVAIIADEWGNWHDVEPGTNPAFLYQQNTLRDAVTAAFYLNMFNNHCKRVKMANIAQTVNVLQSMILTKDEKIVLTPTYYVFKMFTVHHDALMLPVNVTCDKLKVDSANSMPSISVSSSLNKEGIINVTITNIDPEKEKIVSCTLDGIGKLKQVSAQMVTADKMNALNDFDKPEEINIKSFNGYTINGSLMKIKLPAKSVVLLSITK